MIGLIFGLQVIVMANGCMCCRVRGDFVDAFKSIFATATAGNHPELDGILLELSGLSDLAPVVQTFFSDPFVQARVQLDAVVCVCDALATVNALQTLYEHETEVLTTTATTTTTSLEQTQAQTAPVSSLIPPRSSLIPEKSNGVTHSLGHALAKQLELFQHHVMLSDRVLLNKIDLLEPTPSQPFASDSNATVADLSPSPLPPSNEALQMVQSAIHRINPHCHLIPCVRAQVDLTSIMNISAFSLARSLDVDADLADLFSEETGQKKIRPSNEHAHRVFTSVGVEISDEPIDWKRFETFFVSMLKDYPTDICRMKAVIWTSTGDRQVVHSVFGHVETERGVWPVDASTVKRTRVVFIGVFGKVVKEKIKNGIQDCRVSRTYQSAGSTSSTAASVASGTTSSLSSLTNSVLSRPAVTRIKDLRDFDSSL
jgi:G3E family GTPase